ncbi:Cytochrome P450 CYP2 subfamily [Ceraceosorus bombacis]|uniref:Cytochrome P450 CYP2 subfamily n=1 Tax=Ceraceosorus bombacis TaxID=401625 RepID=A0A0P1BAU6_9BASI|nr:Cytochrome P450 CYP2 subfamily [Ceraceosorus bombacis]
MFIAGLPIAIVAAILLATAPVSLTALKRDGDLPPIVEELSHRNVPYRWRAWAEASKKYGDVFRVADGSEVQVVLNSAKAAVELLDRRADIYSCRPRLVMAWQMASEELGITFAPHGPLFRQHRRVLTPAFSSKAVRGYEGAITAETKLLLRGYLDAHKGLSIANDAPKHSHGVEEQNKTPTHFLLCQKFAASLIMRIVYGRAVSSLQDEDLKTINECNERFFRLAGTRTAVDRYPFLAHIPRILSPWGRAAKACFDAEIGLFRKQLERLELLPEEQKSGRVAQQAIELGKKYSLTRDQIAYLAGSMYGAGSETTAQAMLVILMALALYPVYARRAQKEIDDCIEAGSFPAMHDLDGSRLAFSKAIVQEAMRWRPFVASGAPHRLTKDDVYRGWRIPKGTTVFGNTHAIYHDPEVWVRPDEFLPDRHLPRSDLRREAEFSARRTPFSFGFGRRMCPGHELATRALEYTLVCTLWAFDVLPPSALEPQIDTCAFTDSLGSYPKPFFCHVAPRNPQSIAALEAFLERDHS